MAKSRTAEADEKTLKTKVKKTLETIENPEGDADVRALRKRLKRVQRKRRCLAERKRRGMAKTTGEGAGAAAKA